MAIGKRARFEIFKRDKFTCQYCGRRPPDVTLEADHILPRSEGGSDDPANLTTACFACNRGKSNIGLADSAPAFDEMIRLSALQEMQERKRDLALQVEVARQVADQRNNALATVLQWWRDRFGVDLPGGEAEVQSVLRFMQRLPLEQISEAIDATYQRELREDLMPLDDGSRFKYFCGACWRMIRRREGD